MADSFIQLNTDGSGKKLDSRTEGTNTEHRQVIVVGDPATNANVAPVDATNGLAVQVIPALPTGTNNIGKISLSGSATGGLSLHRLISGASTNATSVKSSAGCLYGWHIYNAHATDTRYFKAYNKASAPTVGTDTPVLTLVIPALTVVAVAHPNGLGFSTGIAYGTTWGLADNHTGVIGADELVINLTYA